MGEHRLMLVTRKDWSPERKAQARREFFEKVQQMHEAEKQAKRIAAPDAAAITPPALP
jgi:hypothetical protein